MGTEIAYQAIRRMNEEERGQIHIAGYGGARILPKSLCAGVTNYVSNRDCIPFISDPIGVLLGYFGIGRDIEFCDSNGWWGLDHFYSNETYQNKSLEFHYNINKLQMERLEL